MKSQKTLYVAFDFGSVDEAKHLASQLDPNLVGIKVGKHMFTRFGPVFVTWLVEQGFSVFLDLKFHDIPNTVADSCKAAADLGVAMVNVHASGGMKMMQAARAAVGESPDAPALIAVTILTSLSDAEVLEIGYRYDSALEAAVSLAKQAYQCKLDGVVCSALEASKIKDSTDGRFLTVTPGIRLSTDSADDQVRVMTPVNAKAAGSDILIMGRSITHAEHPAQVVAQICRDLGAAG